MPYLSFSRTLIALALFSCLSSQIQARQFTNTAGKVIEADIVKGNQSTVTLKMANGKSITAKQSLFSAEDQKYIATWLEEHPPQLNYRFELEQGRKRLSKSKNRSNNVTVLREEWAFTIKVKNLSKDGSNNADVADLKVAYKIYRSTVADARSSGSGSKSSAFEGKYLVTTGSESISELPYLKVSEIETIPVTLSTSQLDPNYYYGDGDKPKRRDKLEGIWIKLYHKDKQVGEYKSSGKAIKGAVWK